MSSCPATMPARTQKSILGMRGTVQQLSQWMKSCPVTMGAALLALVAFIFPSLLDYLVLDFDRVAAGQWWRLVTGHATHFGGSHLFWDLLMFVVLGAACERQHSRHFGVALVLMALGVAGAVTFVSGDMNQYRGLSGVDTGLFVWFIADQLWLCLSQRDRFFSGFWIAAGCLLIAKLLFEAVTGAVLFVDAAGFKPLVESHLAGAVCGAIFAIVFRSPRGA